MRQLNRPIGHRVEDAEVALASYEKILADLKKFKSQLEELHRTAGANVNELRTLLQQQEELILAIENQMVKMRGLISLRHGYMELVTGITGFLIQYTEVVKEVERSNAPSAEKVKKYDEAIARIDECETRLAQAADKGQQIAAEGSSQDKNKVTCFCIGGGQNRSKRSKRMSSLYKLLQIGLDQGYLDRKLDYSRRNAGNITEQRFLAKI